MSEPPIDPDHALRPHGVPEQSEVVLRNRDVQALSRAFRRMAEVQEALIDHIDESEARRGRPWLVLLLALGCLALGGGLAVFGMAWWQKQQPQPPVEVRLDGLPEPRVEVQPPAVTVEARDGGVDAELLERLVARMEAMGATQEEDRKLIAQLGSRLVDSELAAVRLMSELQVRGEGLPQEASARSGGHSGKLELPGEDAAGAGAPGTGDAPADAAAAAADAEAAALDEAWLGALNGLMAFDGHPQYSFQQGRRVAGKPELRDVLLLIRGDDGLLDSVVRAERAVFSLQQASYSLEILLRDGSRTRAGRKAALPEGGLRVVLADVDAPTWLDHFPALAGSVRLDALPAVTRGPSGGTAPGTGDGAPGGGGAATRGEAAAPDPDGDSSAVSAAEAEAQAARVEKVRRAVDALLAEERAYGHYRLNKLRGLGEDALLGVQLAWYDARGRLVKYIEADRLEFATRGAGWLELRFVQGSFRNGDERTPFHDGHYRLHLPDQDLELWRASGALSTASQP